MKELWTEIEARALKAERDRDHNLARAEKAEESFKNACEANDKLKAELDQAEAVIRGSNKEIAEHEKLARDMLYTLRSGVLSHDAITAYIKRARDLNVEVP